MLKGFFINQRWGLALSQVRKVLGDGMNTDDNDYNDNNANEFSNNTKKGVWRNTTRGGHEGSCRCTANLRTKI